MGPERHRLYWFTYGVLLRGMTLLNAIPFPRVSVRMGADRLYARTFDRWLAAHLWKFGLAEAHERALIRAVVIKGMVAVDVGANIGLHTLALARAVGKEGRVHALEPEAQNFGLLARAVRRADLTQVTLHAVAAAESSGTALLHRSNGNRGDHRLVAAEDSRETVAIETVTLDALLADEPHVDFLKIDVQGFEVSAFRGFKKTLARNPGIQILCEVSPELLRRAGARPEELFSILAEAGLAPHAIDKKGALSPIDEATACATAESQGYINLCFKKAAP